MRILANYGYKANGDTYSVTFETIGDVPKEQASATVDELFHLAKQAVQRQIGALPFGEVSKPPPVEAGVTVPKPKEQAEPVNNGSNGNGGNNGEEHRHKIKDPSLPASSKTNKLNVILMTAPLPGHTPLQFLGVFRLHF